MSSQTSSRANTPAVIAVELAAATLTTGIVTADGFSRLESQINIKLAAGPNAVCSQMEMACLDLLRRARAEGIEPGAIGVSTFGQVDPATGGVQFPGGAEESWIVTEVGERLASATALKVAVENQWNAHTLAERHFGQGRQSNNFALLWAGNSVGGGCFVQGRLLRGSKNLAGALGHIPIMPDGNNCACGLRGCLEAYTGATALLGFANGRFPNVDQLIMAANNGDHPAMVAVTRMAGFMAWGIMAIAQILDPELVVVAGPSVGNNRLLLPEIERALAARFGSRSARLPRIRLSTVGERSGFYGAAAVGFALTGGVLESSPGK